MPKFILPTYHSRRVASATLRQRSASERACRAVVLILVVVLASVAGATWAFTMSNPATADGKPSEGNGAGDSSPTPAPQPTIVQMPLQKRDELCSRNDCVNVINRQLGIPDTPLVAPEPSVVQGAEGNPDEPYHVRRQLNVPDSDDLDLDINDDGMPDQPITWTSYPLELSPGILPEDKTSDGLDDDCDTDGRKCLGLDIKHPAIGHKPKEIVLSPEASAFIADYPNCPAYQTKTTAKCAHRPEREMGVERIGVDDSEFLAFNYKKAAFEEIKCA